jgi:16S rRNA (cytosine1402-N4)-methyltransferase
LDEVLEALQVQEDGIYVDATYGRGGHAQAMRERLGSHGRLVVLDRDPEAMEEARGKYADDARVLIKRGPFSMLGEAIASYGWTGGVKGILFDLGLSSPQLDDPRRGFSFRHDGPLDMRMDPTSGIPAADWLAHASEQEIAEVIQEYGEERFSRRLARAIVRERARQPITTTLRLAEIVRRTVPTRETGRDPATRTFQAIRIHINRELEELEETLPQAVRALAVGGRLAVISFHSLEDRLVKRFLRTEAKGKEIPPGLPVRQTEFAPRLKLVGKAIRVGPEEARRNPRARSAVLRAAERTGVPYA